LSDYQTTFLGGNSGPAVIPGDPENSTIIIVQASGDHPVQFSDVELDQIREWIDSGAPEN
jgi:hypothetical protein